MLGSLTFYRRILKDNVFSSPSILAISRASNRRIGQVEDRLPTLGHGVAGIMAGVTVSFIAAPVEHIKARLQVQYAADKSKRLYTGPIDCIQKIVCDSLLEVVSPVSRLHKDSGSGPRNTGHIPRSFRHPSLSLLLLLLVGLLWHFYPLPVRPHQTLRTFHQLLGRWSFSPSLLAYLLPIRCR